MIRFNAVTHQTYYRNPKGEVTGYPVLPEGEYDFMLVLDAEGIGAKEIRLGKHKFPDDFLKKDDTDELWRLQTAKGGYAVFLERTLENKLVAKVYGELPKERLDQLKQETPTKEFTFVQA